MGLKDQYDDSLADRLASGGNAFAVTPHDTNDLTQICRAIYVGVAGDLKVITARGDTVTFKTIVAGCIHPIAVKRVFSTGTTATNIVALY